MRPVVVVVLVVVVSAIAVASAPPQPAHASSARQYQLNSIVSSYLSHLINRPASAHNRGLAHKTNLRLSRAARGAPRSCRRSVGRVQRAVGDLRPSARVKRQRILRHANRFYVDC